MRSVLVSSLVALVAGACSPSQENAASSAPPAGVQWTATVLYNQPKDLPNFATGGFTVLLGQKTN